MIKGVALVAKKAGMDDAAFHRYWKEVHGPIALRISALRKYVQSHRLGTPLPGFENVPYDGVAEVWFDSLADLTGMAQNPEYVTGAQADEPNFIDTSKLQFLATHEHLMFEEEPLKADTRWIKAVFLLKRRPDLTVAQFQDYWKNGHAPQIPRDMGVLRYVQCHQVPETYASGTPAYDGMAELWFADMDAFMRYWTSPRIQQIFGDDAPRFLGEGCTAFLAEEHRVRWPGV
ncbi:MAG: EthD family reductase [Gammaproteobacteria bacterium]|nr:EthD family reductase [Gammaproteobacteria bacterium]